MLETDVLVIGGGATGGGIAWDLALRGVRVILAEMGDLATGTSGRYHGLLHSGGRYAVRDGESAKECIDENRIMRRIAPEAVEDTSGFFILCPGDDPAYVDPWLKGCAAAGIETRPVPLGEALRRERTLNPKIEAVYEVPDGTCDSWDLLHALQKGAEATGRAQFLTYHRVEMFHKQGTRVARATLRDLRTDATIDVTFACAINAAGPWAAEIGRLAGASFNMRLSRGAMLAYNIRWVNTVINKLRAPGDGDIFVPVGTVSVIGTTSVTTPDPGDVRVEPWEVTRILDEAEAMTPGISRARILRAWGGVRPLYDPGGAGRDAKRTFTVLDHATSDGVEGIVSVLGGKLTTYRLMAEKVSDVVCAKLGVTTPCVTATTVLPPVHEKRQHIHKLRDRLNELEHGEKPGELICECEIVTRTQIIDALQSGEVVALNDLRRDLRLGMGPCQGGFCAYRAACIRHEYLNDTPEHTTALLSEFAERRFGGMKPLLWGHNLRQALLAEHIYGRILGLFGGSSAANGKIWQAVYRARAQRPTMIDAKTSLNRPHAVIDAKTSLNRPRIVIVGAGLAGLTAALVALGAGARVELVAQGQGALTLHPGWIELGDVDALAQQAGHPYAHAAGSLAAGLIVLDGVIPLKQGAGWSGLGRTRPREMSGKPYPVRVVGFAGWRDFYPRMVADGMRAEGWSSVETSTVAMPDFGGNFDNWSTELANWLDTPEGFDQFVREVRANVPLNPAETLYFPAVLGFKPNTLARLREALGSVVEIPTLPPSIPGLRLYHTLRRAILDRGGRVTIGSTVSGLENGAGRVTGVRAQTAAHGRTRLIPADAVILATGGLFGGGLDSDYQGHIREVVADLHVAHVPPLADWFAHPLLGGEVQPIHRAGLVTDADMRPLDAFGSPTAPNLYAAGRLLAGYSPVVEGSTEGVDIATGAHAALRALEALGAT